MNSKLNAPHLQSEEAAREAMERIRWPNGPVCHHCGETKRRYPTKRRGRYRCGNPDCRKDFTVMTGSVMERSHIPLHKWFQAYYLMCSSKKGVSSKQIERTLGVTYKAAWFLTHRIREAMRAGGLVPPPALGGEGKVVEADETYFGWQENPKPAARRTTPYTKGGKSGPSGKRAVLALVERGGHVRSFHLPAVDKVSVVKIVRENIPQREPPPYGREQALSRHGTARRRT
jgi:transposase-like protein